MLQETARFEREQTPQIAPDLLATNRSASEAVVRGAEFLVIIDDVGCNANWIW